MSDYQYEKLRVENAHLKKLLKHYEAIIDSYDDESSEEEEEIPEEVDLTIPDPKDPTFNFKTYQTKEADSLEKPKLTRSRSVKKVEKVLSEEPAKKKPRVTKKPKSTLPPVSPPVPPLPSSSG
jgi:hypothetical protein